MTAPRSGGETDADADASPRRPAHPAVSVPGGHADDAPHNGSAIPTVHIREVRQGHMPGERFVRIHRPFHETFRETGSDTLVAREHVFVPRSKTGIVVA